MQMNGAVVNQGTIMGGIHPLLGSQCPHPKISSKAAYTAAFGSGVLTLVCKQNQIMPQDQFLSIREKGRLSLIL